MRHVLFTALCTALTVACGIDVSEVPEDGPPPVSGGGLHVTRDGRYAIASDPDRASIHVVDLVAGEEMHRIELGDEDEPGRVISDGGGRVHVVLRRAGQVATLSADLSEVSARRPVCQAPRGIDFVDTTGELVVACADGTLAFMAADGGGITRTIALEPDLRDVIARADGTYLVSSFRRAEILVVEGGIVARRLRPPLGTPTSLAPTVAWRMRETPIGVLLVHQYSTTSQLGTLGMPGGTYYGGDCQYGVVRSAVSVLGPDESWQTAGVSGASLVVDGAVAGSTVALAAASDGELRMGGLFTLVAGALSSVYGCQYPEPESDYYSYPAEGAGAAIAVEPLADGRILAQYRDPAILRIESATRVVESEIALSGGRAVHFGHAIFHEAAGTGATCASCHPEGGDDGHVWQFDIGPRRTQTLTGGILSTAPFHWVGDVPNVASVMEGTFVGRMGGATPREYETESLATWMDSLPALRGPTSDETAVARGHAVFDGAGCAECHAGAHGTNSTSVDVGTGGSFQVPALTEVAFHSPYFHDGSATSLSSLLGGHEGAAKISTSDRADLEAYLLSL